MTRFLNLVVIAALVIAAVWVYKIKFDSTLQVERVAKLRGEIRREHDAIATLRAEWGRLDTPGRIQVLADRYLQLRQVQAHQVVDSLDRLPGRPPTIVQPAPQDPVGAMIDPEDAPTGSIAAPPKDR